MSQAYGNVPGNCPREEAPIHSIEMAHRVIRSIKGSGREKRGARPRREAHRL